MRKALITGIDYYKYHTPLKGCVNDAHAVDTVLERHDNGTLNFNTKLLIARGSEDQILRSRLKHQLKELFKDESETALFYFSGHGHLESTGGYLMTSECNDGDEGLSMNELLDITNKSLAKHKVIILDCCHSGMLGTPGITQDKAVLSKGVTILTASSAQQYASEKNGSGVFTSLLVDALEGAAANLTGHVTPGSIYAYIDKSLGPWQQRPIFRANLENFSTLRTVHPPISLQDLLRITEFFTKKDSEFALDPTYEPTSENVVQDHAETFSILQKYNRVNLVVPSGAPHMYNAAIASKSCVLTVFGQQYWKLVKNKRL